MPPIPVEAWRALQWDVRTPVRPWEWWQLDAEEWTEARQIQEAYQNGIDDANAEQADS